MDKLDTAVYRNLRTTNSLTELENCPRNAANSNDRVWKVMRGCPQGGMLHPWNFVMYDLREVGYTVIGCVDDIAIFMCEKFQESWKDTGRIVG